MFADVPAVVCFLDGNTNSDQVSLHFARDIGGGDPLLFL